MQKHVLDKSDWQAVLVHTQMIAAVIWRATRISHGQFALVFAACNRSAELVQASVTGRYQIRWPDSTRRSRSRAAASANPDWRIRIAVTSVAGRHKLAIRRWPIRLARGIWACPAPYPTRYKGLTAGIPHNQCLAGPVVRDHRGSGEDRSSVRKSSRVDVPLAKL